MCNALDSSVGCAEAPARTNTQALTPRNVQVSNKFRVFSAGFLTAGEVATHFPRARIWRLVRPVMLPAQFEGPIACMMAGTSCERCRVAGSKPYRTRDEALRYARAG